MEIFSIGQVARLAGVGVETVRFYEREGLLEKPVRRASGYRQYSEEVIKQIRFIKRAQQLGFSLKEILELLTLRVDGESSCEQAKERAAAKLAEVEQARSAGKQQVDVPILARLLRCYDELLREGYLANPPPPPPSKSEHSKRKPGKAKQGLARNLLNRFSLKKLAILRFLHDFAVPFDNNQAERDLRMIKVQQKVSGGFRTEEGVTMFCRIRSYLSTLRKQGIDLFSALNHTLLGNPVLPAFA